MSCGAERFQRADHVQPYTRSTTSFERRTPVKRALIRPGAGCMLAALTLLATLRLLAAPPVSTEADAKPLEVTYYFLPG